MSGGTRAPTRVSGRGPAPRRRLRGGDPRLAWAVAGVLALACAALAAVLVLDDDQPRGGAVRVDSEASVSAREPAGSTVGFPVRVDEAPTATAVGSRSVWVLREGSGTVVRVDPVRSEVAGPPIPVGGRPRYMVITAGGLWVSNFGANTVTRVGAGSRRVTSRIAVGRSPWGIAVAPGAIWVVSHDDDSIQEISSTSGELVGSPIQVGQAPVDASYGYGAVWVSNSQDDTVSRVDVGARAVTRTIPVGDHPEGLSAGAGGIWVANLEDDTVSRIDPATNRVAATIPVGDRPLHLKAAGPRVWVPNSGDGTLSVIDSKTNKVIGAPIAIGRSVERVGSGQGAIWVTNAAEDTVTRVEPTAD